MTTKQGNGVRSAACSCILCGLSKLTRAQIKAVFKLEVGFDLSTGQLAQSTQNFVAPVPPALPTKSNTVTLFGRQAFVGLSGGFGEVRFGRQYSAYDEARGGADMMEHTAFSATVGSANAWENNGRAYAFRINNMWRYATPNFSGFTAAVGYGLGENKTPTTSAGGVLSMHLAYNNGPISAFFAHQQEKNPAGAPALSLTLADGGIGINGTKETHTFLSGAYDLGVAKLRIGYNQSKDNGVGAANADKEFTFGVAAPLGPVSLAAEFATSKNNASKANSLGIQAKYNLSKRTFAYTGFTTGKLTTTPAAPAVGGNTKVQLIAVGIRHGF